MSYDDKVFDIDSNRDLKYRNTNHKDRDSIAEMEQKTLLFTDQKIKEMIIPLFLEQLLLFSVGFSVVIMLFVLVGNRWMLQLLFGKVEAPVMDACVTYLRISAYSYPALAIYNAGAAVYRSLGRTNVTIGNLAGTDPQCFQCDSISFFGCLK